MQKFLRSPTKLLNIQRVMSSESTTSAVPRSPSDVLNFWFNNGWNTSKLSEESFLNERMGLWFGMGQSPEDTANNDAKCMPYVDLIHAAGSNKLSNEKEWQTADGLYAQMILCDQFTRNCFRGTSEAFQYDHIGVEFVKKIYNEKYYLSYDCVTPFIFLVTPGQHSEHIKDHEMNLELVNYMNEKYPGGMASYLSKHVEVHKAVIERFGRYPHRNSALGRDNTPEEAEWLADIDSLPSWARSQQLIKK